MTQKNTKQKDNRKLKEILLIKQTHSSLIINSFKYFKFKKQNKIEIVMRKRNKK